MEIVLGADNLVFIEIPVGRAPEEQHEQARLIGLSIAVVARIGLLFSVSWMFGLVEPLLTIAGHPVSGADLLMLGGGGFLLYKAIPEPRHLAAHPVQRGADPDQQPLTLRAALIQIVLMDLMFSLDSVLVAAGITDELLVIVVAILVAVAVMLVVSGPLIAFVNAFPSVKILALAILALIGGSMLADGLGQELPKTVLFTAIVFGAAVEALNFVLIRRSAADRADAARSRFTLILAISAGSRVGKGFSWDRNGATKQEREPRRRRATRTFPPGTPG